MLLFPDNSNTQVPASAMSMAAAHIKRIINPIDKPPKLSLIWDKQFMTSNFLSFGFPYPLDIRWDKKLKLYKLGKEIFS